MGTELIQSEIDYLLKLEKHCIETNKYLFPDQGGKIEIPLVSADRREEFKLDISRSHVNLSKNTFQNRARKTIVLLRLDLGGAPHRNPDGTEIPSPHLHINKEGFGDKVAYPLPDFFKNCVNTEDYLKSFMDYCHITQLPKIEIGLFV